MREATSAGAGAMFAVAWWLWIDAHVNREHLQSEGVDPLPPQILVYYYIPGFCATIALIMLNMVDLDTLNPYSWAFDETISVKVRVWLFASFIISFCSIGAAIWIMAGIFMPPNNQGSQYPGIALIVQNFLILLSALILLYGRSSKPEEEGYSAI